MRPREFNIGPFAYQTASRTWSFRPPGYGCLTIGNATCAVTINDRRYRLDEAVSASYRRVRDDGRQTLAADFVFHQPDVTLSVRFAFEAPSQSLFISASLRNDSHEALILTALDLIHLDAQIGGIMALGKAPARVTRFNMATWDTCVKRLADGTGPQWSHYIGHLYNPAEGVVFYAGFETVHRTVAGVEVTYGGAKGVTHLRAWCAYTKHDLAAGESLTSELLRVCLYRDPYQPLEQWADALQRQYRPRLNPKTTVGWLGWAWVDTLSPREEVFEAVVKGNAEAIRQRLAGFDIDYIWMSQVNLKDMVPGNWLDFNRQHFPHGFEKTLKALQHLGFKPGLWIAPFWLFGKARRYLEENRANLVRRKDTTPLMSPTSWEFIQSDSLEPDEFELFWLDGSHPKTVAFLKRIFRAYHRLGIRYYMLDFLGCAAERRNHRPSATWTEADRALMEAIRQATGPDTHLLTAVGSTPAYTGCTDAARVNTDFGEGRPLFPPFRCMFNATYVVHDPYYGNIRKFLQNATSTYFTHRKLYINDYNLMTVDKPVPRNIAEITATVFGLSGSPIMLGDDIRWLHPERLALLKKCLPRTHDTARPLDLFQRPQPDDYARVLVLPVTTPWDQYCLVGVVNLDPVTWRTTLTARELGLNPTVDYSVFDFWQEEYGGRFRGKLTVNVPPLTARLLRIAQVRPHPWLLSTDMHVQQGRVEVTALTWDARKRVLAGTATRPKGETGNLFFLMPPELRLVNHEGHYLMKDGTDGSVIIRRSLTFRRPAEPFALQFEVLDKAARPISYFVEAPKRPKPRPRA